MCQNSLAKRRREKTSQNLVVCLCEWWEWKGRFWMDGHKAYTTTRPPLLACAWWAPVVLVKRATMWAFFMFFQTHSLFVVLVALFYISSGIHWFRPKFNKRVNTILLLACFERNFHNFVEWKKTCKKKTALTKTTFSFIKEFFENSILWNFFSFDSISQRHFFMDFF